MDPARIEQLRDPRIYPDRPESVEILQTHLSVVVLAGDSAYKFKKAIRLPFADFSTLEKRRFCCEEEVRLNRRLCPEIYEGVVELWSDGGGGLRIGNGIELVDCAVKMRRMPQDRMMDRLLERNAVGRDVVEAIARRVVAFHRKAVRGPEVAAWGDPERLHDFALANFTETRGSFPAKLHSALEARTRRDFARILPILKRRAAGFIVDGHGDLHARNICLVDPPVIYDCIEFNPAFRCGDVATEHAFLVMDLHFRGHPELAEAYLAAVIEESGDQDLRGLLPTLVRYRAMVRAKVSAITAGETEFSPEAQREAAETALRYFRLAAVSAAAEDGPRWLLCCGLPASGKSVIASELARTSVGAWTILSSDRVRKELAGAAPTETLPASSFAAAFSRRTYDELLARALAATKPGSVVILDANFRSREDRLRFRGAAKGAGARVDLLHVDLDESIALDRLRARAAMGDSESDADATVYAKLKASFETPRDDEADRVFTISGEIPAESAIDRILEVLSVLPEMKNW